MVRNRMGGRYDSLRKGKEYFPQLGLLAIMLTILISGTLFPLRPLQGFVLQVNSACAKQHAVFLSKEVSTVEIKFLPL